MIAGQSIRRNSLIVGLFALCTMGLVVLTHELTEPRIEQARQQALHGSLTQVLAVDRFNNPLLQDFVELPEDPLLGKGNQRVAYLARYHGQPVAALLPATAPDGYGGSIQLLIGIDTQGALTGVRVIPPHFETPGLGDAIGIDKSNWILSFNGRSLINTPESAWAVKKDGGEFDSFTGATITPRAVVAAVYRALQYHAREQSKLFEAQTPVYPATPTATPSAPLLDLPETTPHE